MGFVVNLQYLIEQDSGVSGEVKLNNNNCFVYVCIVSFVFPVGQKFVNLYIGCIMCFLGRDFLFAQWKAEVTNPVTILTNTITTLP